MIFFFKTQLIFATYPNPRSPFAKLRSVLKNSVLGTQKLIYSVSSTKLSWLFKVKIVQKFKFKYQKNSVFQIFP